MALFTVLSRCTRPRARILLPRRRVRQVTLADRPDDGAAEAVRLHVGALLADRLLVIVRDVVALLGALRRREAQISGLVQAIPPPSSASMSARPRRRETATCCMNDLRVKWQLGRGGRTTHRMLRAECHEDSAPARCGSLVHENRGRYVLDRGSRAVEDSDLV